MELKEYVDRVVGQTQVSGGGNPYNGIESYYYHRVGLLGERIHTMELKG